MHPPFSRLSADPLADQLVDLLSREQFLFPHQSLGATLATVANMAGLCTGAADRALQSLRIDPNLAVGRLLRSQLLQLARTIHRYWRQSVAEETRRTQPA